MRKVLAGLLSIVFVLSMFTGCNDPYKDQVFSSDFDENDLGGLFIGDISLDVPAAWEDSEIVADDKKENLRIYNLGHTTDIVLSINFRKVSIYPMNLFLII